MVGLAYVEAGVDLDVVGLHETGSFARGPSFGRPTIGSKVLHAGYD